MTKRLLSLLLVLMMLLSVVPVQVFAVEGDPLNQVVNDEEQYLDGNSELVFDQLEEGEEEATPVYSELVVQLQIEIDGMMMQYGITAEMSDDEIAAAIGAANSDALYATTEQIGVLEQQINTLTPAEALALDTVLFERFRTILNQMSTPVILTDTAETVEYVVDSYEGFLYNLSLLEELAGIYIKEAPGVDPLMLIIKYIRTGVDRYNSGSWNIMAGYEDPEFAAFVKMMEDGINEEIAAAGGSEADMIRVSALKNLKNFVLPNGDEVDFGHMFGTMDITYHNNGSVNHADVSGWAGDLVDLLSTTDRHGVTGTLEEMVADISANYLNKVYPGESDQFGLTDMYGDLDGFYIMEALSGMEYEMGALTELMMGYFTEDLTDEDRAAFLLKNRLGNVSTRSAIRDAVYNAYTGNKVITTLESTREFVSDDLENLRKACCYAFADYLCKLAGDYVEYIENPFYTVFSSETAVLAPGITQDIKFATNSEGNQIVYYIATADITRDDVNVYANYNENDPSKGWAMSRVEDQANAAQAKYGDPESEYYIPNYNVIVSTNGAGFDMKTGEPGGLLVMGGVEYHPINSSGFFGILKDGTPVIGTTEEYNTIYKDQVQEGIAGFGARLIRNGEICISGSDFKAPRTAVGITATGKVVLMVLDGRGAPWSDGAGMPEIAQIMYEAGCVEAVNLDGGGSSTFVARQPGEDALSVVNQPSDGYARSVSASLMMVSTAPSSTAFDHALIESDYRYLTMGATMQMTAKGVSATGNTAELPEGAYWAVSNENYGSITEDGLFTALRSNGSVDVCLMVGEEVIGSKTLDLVTPDNVYFTKDNINVVYGQSVKLPVKALYQNKEVAFIAEDLVFSLSSEAAGSVNGFYFTAAENSGIKNVKITVQLKDGSKSDSIEVSLYNQGEMTFDFERATGGDRQMAWDRQVSNAITEDAVTYEVVDPDEAMVTSYTFAIDMTQIPIPEVLHDLVYMLPGADQVAVEDATAWDFLLNLAERVSVLTEVKPTITFDQSLDVDYSELKIINEYFDLTGTEFDEETNTLTLTLNWIDQTKAIDPAVANPMCIVSGIKLTPKADVDWGAKSTLEVVNSGAISYTACMRASALYSLALKPEAQEQYQIYPYVNPDDASDKGGSFGATYKEFKDEYKLVNELKEGWYNEDGGFAYYVAGEKLTGVQEIEGLYYDLGETGINVGKTPYTGTFEKSGKLFYAKLGELATGWYSFDEEWYFFDWQTAEGGDGTYTTTIDGVKVTYEFEDGRLVKGYWHRDSKGLRYFYGPYYHKQGWKEIDGESYFFEDYYAYTGIRPVRPVHTKEATWYEFDENGALVGDVSDGLYWFQDDLYYVISGQSYQVGLYCIDGDYYYFLSDNTAIVNETRWINRTNDLMPAGTYRFDAEGKMIMTAEVVEENGTLYYYKDGRRADNLGLVEYNGDFYCVSSGGAVIVNETRWINRTNGLKPAGEYTFGADGKMVIYDGIYDGYYYVDGVKTAAGMLLIDGNYYFAGSGGVLYADKSAWVSRNNDLLPAGVYLFGADGKIIMEPTITNEDGVVYYYADGMRAANVGLVLMDGAYYCVSGGGAVIVNETRWINRTNGLKPAGEYTFGADGKMVILNGIHEGYYYVDGTKTAAGMLLIDGNYYFAGSGGALYAGKSTWVSRNNDLLPAGVYLFGADGKIIMEPTITNEDGVVYYYAEGKRADNAGLVLVDGDYYCVSGGGAVLVSQTRWINRTNGLKPVGEYTFGADGKMVIYNGIHEGYYYVNGERVAAGMLLIDGSYYFAGNGGVLYAGKSAWVSRNNDLLPAGVYLFAADGKIIMEPTITNEDGVVYYYADGMRADNVGLVLVNGDYYCVSSGGAVLVSQTRWINRTNGLKPAGEYTFGADGKMVIYNGIHEGYYYVNGERVAAGMLLIDGSYYFAGNGGVLYAGKSAWVSRNNDLLPAGVYLFGADGKIIMEPTITNEDGVVYYYAEGKRADNVGLVLVDGDYYCVSSGGAVLVSQTRWINRTNGLKPAGEYTFGADGKMVTG